MPNIDPEFQALIPPLSAEEYAQLEADIVKEGRCRDTIKIWDNLIIDGHHRWEIALKHKLNYQLEDMWFLQDREEAILWIINNQLGRRNISKSARIELSKKKNANLKEQGKTNQATAGGDKKSLSMISSKAVNPVDTRKAVAKDADVSEDTVRKHDIVMAEGSPDLKAEVMQGKKKINAAYNEVKNKTSKKPKTKPIPLRKKKNDPYDFLLSVSNDINTTLQTIETGTLPDAVTKNLTHTHSHAGLSSLDEQKLIEGVKQYRKTLTDEQSSILATRTFALLKEKIEIIINELR